MVGRHSLLIFLNQVPRFLIVVDLIFFVFGGYCCEVVPSAWRRHEVNISLGHGGKRLLKFVLVVEVKNILNNKKVSPGLTFVEVDFPDYKLAGLAVREFAMSIHEVGKCISVQSFRPDLFLVLLAFGKGKLAHELEFYLVLDHLEEIFLQTKSQGVVQRKIFPLPLADQLLVRLVSLGQNQLFELIKRDVIFAVELEIGEDQFLLGSRAPQSQVSDAVDELGFGLCVRAVRRVDGENARRDEVGVGCQDLATILKFSLVGRYFVEIGCDVKGAHDGRCKIIITHFSCYIQQSLFRKQARFLGLQSTKIGQQRSYGFFSCHNQPLLACGYRRVLKNNCHRPQISMFKTAFLVNQFPLVGLYILL